MSSDLVISVNTRQAETSLQRFIQGSERAANAVRPLEDGRRVNIETATAVGGLRNLSREAQSTYDVLVKMAQATAMIAAGSKSIGFFTSAIKEAASYREDVAQFEHVFRNVKDEAAAMVKTLQSNSFGRTEREAMQLTMGLGSMLKGMDLTDKAAVELSGDFAKMAVDIGSFMAKDPSDVMNAMQGALMGNTMALRTYGVFITDASLKAKMLEDRKNGLVFASEREAKAYAILGEVQRQQSDAIGDFSVESQNYRNQVDALSKGLKDLKRNIGETFVEPATKVVQSLNSMVDWMKTLDQRTVAFAATSGAVVTGLGIAGVAYRTLSPLVGALASATGLSAASVTAETAALTANTTALASNAAARRLATGTQQLTPARMRGNRQSVSDGRWRAAEYAFMDRVTGGGSFGITGGPIDFSRANRPGRLSSRAARAFERTTGTERTRNLSSGDMTRALNVVRLERSISRLSLGFRGLEGPASRLIGVASRLSPVLGRAVSYASPIGAVAGSIVTIGSVARNFPMQMERIIDGIPDFSKALERQLKTLAFETVPNAFSTLGKSIYSWGGETAYGLQQILARPFGATDTTNLYQSQKAIDRMLNRDMGRLNSKGEAVTLSDVVEENRTKYGESATERERKRIEAGDEQYKKLSDVLGAFQEDMQKALKTSDDQYRFDSLSPDAQLKIFEKQLSETERQIKLFNEGNKDFILGLNMSAEELEKWSKDIVTRRDKIRGNIDNAWQGIESEEKAAFDKAQAEYKKRFDRMSKDEQYGELSRQLKDELAFQSTMTTATGQKLVQPQIDDLRFQMKPYEKEMQERLEKATEALFDFEFQNASRSDQRTMLKDAQKQYMSQVAGLLDKPVVTSDDLEKSMPLLQKAAGAKSQLDSLKDNTPSLPMVQNTTMQAYDSRSMTAREFEARQWNATTGQKKVEKDTSNIAKYMKKQVDISNKILGKTGKSSDNTVTPDDT